MLTGTISFVWMFYSYAFYWKSVQFCVFIVPLLCIFLYMYSGTHKYMNCYMHPECKLWIIECTFSTSLDNATLFWGYCHTFSCMRIPLVLYPVNTHSCSTLIHCQLECCTIVFLRVTWDCFPRSWNWVRFHKVTGCWISFVLGPFVCFVFFYLVYFPSLTDLWHSLYFGWMCFLNISSPCIVCYFIFTDQQFISRSTKYAWASLCLNPFGFWLGFHIEVAP